jgi:hypothetical protein
MFAEIMGGLGMLGNVAGGLFGGNDGGSEKQTQTRAVADWLLPYQKAAVERQYQLSNQPYKQNPGLLALLAQDFTNEAQPQVRPWDANYSPSMASGDPRLSLVNKQTHPWIKLAAKPGENVPYPVSNKDMARYQAQMEGNPEFNPEVMNSADYKAWLKNNRAFLKAMDNRPFNIGDKPYQQYMDTKLTAQQPQPSVADQYLSSRKLKGLLG